MPGYEHWKKNTIIPNPVKPLHNYPITLLQENSSVALKDIPKYSTVRGKLIIIRT
jgi:hypothetical protein